MTESILVDTYAWIEFFKGTEKGELVKKLLYSTLEVYTPSIALAELARKYVREGVEEELVEKRLSIITGISRILHIDTHIALKAGHAYIELLAHAKKLGLKRKPSLNDAIILAMARSIRAKVLTGDQHFKDLKETIWLGGDN